MVKSVIQVLAAGLLVAALVWAPFKAVVNSSTSSYDSFLGYYLVTSPPENPVEIIRILRAKIQSEGGKLPPFDHAHGSIRVEIEPLRLFSEVIGILVVAGFLTSLMNSGKKRANPTE
jgi:hypothetical protein